MRVEARNGTVVVRFGQSFVTADAERIRNAVNTFAPGSKLVLDFTPVRECQDAALFALASTIRRFRANLTLRGLTRHQLRLLEYLDPAPRSPADQGPGRIGAGPDLR